MVKIEQMNGRGSTNFCIYFQTNDLMWSFTYEWNIMDVPMFFDFSSIKSLQLLPSISGTDVQKHVTCDDQNACWWQLVRYVTWLVWGLHYLQRIGHQFVQCLLVSDVWRWFCPCKSLGMLFVIYHIYIYTYTYTILYNIYIYRFIGKVNFQLDEILANPSYLVVIPFVFAGHSRSFKVRWTLSFTWFLPDVQASVVWVCSSLEKPTCPIMIALNMGNVLEYVILRHSR